MKKIIIIIMFLFFGCSNKSEQSKFVNNHAIFAGYIVDYYHSKGRMIDFKNIYQTIKAIEKYKPETLKEFDLIDLMALAMTESDFDPKAISYANAKGVFQITHMEYLEEINDIKDPFNIDCNVLAGLKILEVKYKYFKDKKKSIIAYNGLVYDKNNNLMENFYNQWSEKRKELQKIYGHTINN